MLLTTPQYKGKCRVRQSSKSKDLFSEVIDEMAEETEEKNGNKAKFDNYTLAANNWWIITLD